MEIEEIKKAVSKIKEGMAILNKGPMEYYIKGLIECREELFRRCAPFELGEEVEIAEALNIEEGSGWYSCRHFLICGAKAVVVGVDFYRGNFRVDVEFHNESWIDFHKNEHKTEDKHSFCIPENKLRLVRSS